MHLDLLPILYTDEGVSNDNDFIQRYNKEIATADATSQL
jgi:hypothetical protein